MMGFLQKSVFTLIEVMAVLILLAIVSVIVVSRLDVSSADLHTASSQLAADLRYAQLLSMSNDNHSWGIELNGSSYQLTKDGSAAAIPLPARENSTVSLSGISVTGSSGNSLVFDAYGSPGDSDITVTLSSGADNHTITITAETGYIP